MLFLSESVKLQITKITKQQQNKKVVAAERFSHKSVPASSLTILVLKSLLWYLIKLASNR